VTISGCRLRKQIEGSFADDDVARNTELRLGHAIDKNITAIKHILHGDLRGNVIDDLVQERIIAIAFLFEVAAFRDVFHRGDPAAMRQRLAGRQIGAPVRALHGRAIDPPLCDVTHDGGTKFVHVAVKRPGILAVLHQFLEMTARFHDFRRQLVHVDVAPVEGDDARGGVIQHQALDHVVQRGVELAPLRLQSLLGFTALPGDLPDDQEQDQGDHRCG